MNDAATEPFPVTRDDVWVGGVWAWTSFVTLMLTALLIAFLIPMLQQPGDPASSAGIIVYGLGFALVLGGGVAFLVMIAGLPLAWLLGRSLRRVRAVGWHVVVYALLGASVGVIGVVIVGLIFTGEPGSSKLTTPLLPISVAITTTSVVFGWWRASRHARRAQPMPSGTTGDATSNNR